MKIPWIKIKVILFCPQAVDTSLSNNYFCQKKGQSIKQSPRNHNLPQAINVLILPIFQLH